MTSTEPVFRWDVYGGGVRPYRDREGDRLHSSVEEFVARVLSTHTGIGRAYVFYQTCKRCKGPYHHEAALRVDPRMWHGDRIVDTGVVSVEVPTDEHTDGFVGKLALPTYAVHNIALHDGYVRCTWRDPNGVERVTHVDDLLTSLWELHVRHQFDAHRESMVSHKWHNFEVTPRGVPGGRDEWHKRVGECYAGEPCTLRINYAFRGINDVTHTDTDVLLVKDDGTPVLLSEDYSGGGKHITYSRSLMKDHFPDDEVLVMKLLAPKDGSLKVEELWCSGAGRERQVFSEVMRAPDFSPLPPSAPWEVLGRHFAPYRSVHHQVH